MEGSKKILHGRVRERNAGSVIVKDVSEEHQSHKFILIQIIGNIQSKEHMRSYVLHTCKKLNSHML